MNEATGTDATQAQDQALRVRYQKELDEIRRRIEDEPKSLLSSVNPVRHYNDSKAIDFLDEAQLVLDGKDTSTMDVHINLGMALSYAKIEGGEILKAIGEGKLLEKEPLELSEEQIEQKAALRVQYKKEVKDILGRLTKTPETLKDRLNVVQTYKTGKALEYLKTANALIEDPNGNLIDAHINLGLALDNAGLDGGEINAAVKANDAKNSIEDADLSIEPKSEEPTLSDMDELAVAVDENIHNTAQEAMAQETEQTPQEKYLAEFEAAMTNVSYDEQGAVVKTRIRVALSQQASIEEGRLNINDLDVAPVEQVGIVAAATAKYTELPVPEYPEDGLTVDSLDTFSQDFSNGLGHQELENENKLSIEAEREDDRLL